MPLPGHTQTVTVNLLYCIGSRKCIAILKMHDAHKNKENVVAYSTGSLALVIGLKCWTSSFLIYLFVKVQLKMPWACEHSGSITGLTLVASAAALIQRKKKQHSPHKVKRIMLVMLWCEVLICFSQAFAIIRLSKSVSKKEFFWVLFSTAIWFQITLFSWVVLKKVSVFIHVIIQSELPVSNIICHPWIYLLLPH